MSGTENNAVVSMAEPQLSQSDFDKLFEAEAKRLAGDETAHKALAKEFESRVPEEEVKEEVVADEATTVVETATQTETETSTETEASATDGGSTQTQEQQDAVDWLASLDPGVKAHVEKVLAEKQALEHKIKSDEGRVAAYQRHYDTARQELEAVRKAAQPNPQSKPPQKDAAAQGQQQTQRVIPPEIQAILDTDEQLGKALLKTYEEAERTNRALREEIDSLKQTTINPLAERQQAIYLQQELDLLEREMPGAREVLAHDIWDDFKSVATPAVRSLAESTNRYEVATALQEYAAWIQRADVQAWAAKKYGAATQQQQQQTATTQQPQQQARPVTDPQQVAQAEKVKAAAERKTQATPVASNTVGRPAAKKLSFDEIMADPKLYSEWFAKQFEEETNKVYGRKSK